MSRLREELAHALYAMDCAETEREYLREGKPVPPKWADPWSPSGTGIRQRKQYYEKADALLLVIGADADAKNAKLQDVIDGIYIYANDTLSGPVGGIPDDRDWQREAVVEIRNRARQHANVSTAINARNAIERRSKNEL